MRNLDDFLRDLLRRTDTQAVNIRMTNDPAALATVTVFWGEACLVYELQRDDWYNLATTLDLLVASINQWKGEHAHGS